MSSRVLKFSPSSVLAVNSIMNKIRQIQELNKKELEQGISPNASWHTDYRDTAFVYFGGLPYELTEGDVITIFSQYGEPVFLKLARDKETGKSKGFGWLKYEDQRSTDLAVDNLGGATIGSRLISVDHARYKARDDEDDDSFKVGWADMVRREGRDSDGDMNGMTPSLDGDDGNDADRRKMEPHRIRSPTHSALLLEERELQTLINDHDDEDPMKTFLIDEKKKAVDDARRRVDHQDKTGNNHKRHQRHQRHHHYHSSRSHRSHHSRHRDDDKEEEDGGRDINKGAGESRARRHSRRDEDGKGHSDRSHRDAKHNRVRDQNWDRDDDRRRHDGNRGDNQHRG